MLMPIKMVGFKLLNVLPPMELKMKSAGKLCITVLVDLIGSGFKMSSVVLNNILAKPIFLPLVTVIMLHGVDIVEITLDGKLKEMLLIGIILNGVHTTLLL